MRTLKFRAWDGNKMTYADMASLVRPNGLDFRLAVHNEAVIMQFTGLKDKNGVEIWDGDIVLHRSAGKQIITWQDITGGWTIQTPGDKVIYLPSVEDMTNLKVLGNIYEHPHLLKES